jgi:DNA-binding LytR/AlgR family response regulator
MEDRIRSDHADSGLGEVNVAALSERVETLLAEVRTARRFPPRLWIRSRGQIYAVNVDEIDWVEADAKYSVVHARGGTHRIRESITAIEARLDPARFVRIHRSAIVHRDRIVEIRTVDGRTHAVLEHGTRVPMSRLQKARVIELIGADASSIQRSVRKSIFGILDRNETTGNGIESR